VEIAEPDAMVQLIRGVETEAPGRAAAPLHKGFPNDPYYKWQWHMRQIDMPSAWKLADGGGITVAVLDTGVGYEDFGGFHLLPDLKGLTFVDGYDFVDNDAHANDDHGHGSHVTGTIAQVTDNGVGVSGIARNVQIMPLKVLSGSGSGSVAGIADAIRYAADKGAKVINMSLGGPFPSRVLKKAVRVRARQGRGRGVRRRQRRRNKVGYPAAYPGAFAVAATQFDESDHVLLELWQGHRRRRARRQHPRRPERRRHARRRVQNTICSATTPRTTTSATWARRWPSPHVAGVAALIVGEGVTDPDDGREDPEGQRAQAEHGQVRAATATAPASSTPRPRCWRRARQAGGWSLLLGLLLAGTVAGSGGARPAVLGRRAARYLVGVVVGASGLFFLPYLAPEISSFPVVEMLTRGLPSWDVALGPLAHGHALFFSALIPLACWPWATACRACAAAGRPGRSACRRTWCSTWWCR
jgi:serine protease